MVMGPLDISAHFLPHFLEVLLVKKKDFSDIKFFMYKPNVQVDYL